MKSTDKKPLVFFEYIINQYNLSKEIDKQLCGYDVKGYRFINSTKIGFEEQNTFGEFESREIEIQELLFPLLYREFQKSKNHFYNYCLINSNQTVENYLRIQFNTIQTLLNNQSDFINIHPNFLLPLRGLVKYINEILILPEMKMFELNESSIIIQDTDDTIDNEFTINQQTDEEIIHLVFDYMNGLNDKREKILSDEDFVLLIRYTTELINNEQISEIDIKLQPKISNDQLSFSYWVLHKKIYTTKRLRNYFYDFLINTFSNFENMEKSSIKSTFGTKSRVVKDSFLPEIIKDYL
jgi:hypothetical protein